VFVQTLGRVKKGIRDLDLPLQIAKQVCDRVSPPLPSHGQKHGLDRFLRRLMCGKARPIIVPILQGVLRMPEVMSRLRQPVPSSITHCILVLWMTGHRLSVMIMMI